MKKTFNGAERNEKRSPATIPWLGWVPRLAASQKVAAQGALAGLVFLATAAMLPGQVVINEAMAYNRSAVARAGVFPDYIELHNSGGAALDLGGMSLDDGGTPPANQYFFPAGTVIPAGGYLVVWCSTNLAVTGLRAPFGLSSDGETVRLRSMGGAIMDEVRFGIQAADYSLGRVPDGAGAWVLTKPSPLDDNESQPLGSPANLRINEWLADPLPTFEDWLEIYNADELPVLLSGLVLTDSTSGYFTNRPLRELSFIADRGFARFFADDLDDGNKTGAEHLDFKLSSNGEIITLYAANRTTILNQVIFGAQVEDYSEGRLPDGSAQIVRFTPAFKTPGEPNYASFKGVVISEVLIHTDPPFEDAIELHNPGPNAVDISHWWLSDSGNNPKKCRIPPGSVIPADGYLVFYEYLFGSPYYANEPFQLDSVEGDTVYLSAGDANGTLTGEQTSFKFGPSLNGISFGRHPTSVGVDFPPMSRHTFGVDDPWDVTQFRTGTGLSNAYPRVGPVVIREIMFAPPPGDEEYLELHNLASLSAPLYHQDYPTNRWRIRNGVEFDLPANLALAAHGTLLVVGFDPGADPARAAAFRQRHDIPETIPILGPFVGKLSDAGESVHLQEPDKPEPWDSSKPGFVPYCQVELIKYATSSPWPVGATDTGNALHRLNLAAYGNEPTNWVAAAPSPGRPTIPPLDTDSDGMPDDWENTHQLNPGSAADATADPDGDGLGNLHEYLAGTHPGDRQSVIKIGEVRLAGDELRLRFRVVRNRVYIVHSRDGLTAGAWQVATNLGRMDIEGDLEVSLPRAPTGQRLHRVEVRIP